MALTQIRDIAFVATEPQNKYNLWLHFKEKRVLVLEMWINGQWTEITNGSINVPFAPDPQPEPPTPTPTHDYPQFNFEDSENNLQVISDIESTYSTINLNGEFGTPAIMYDVLGTYNAITHTIVIVHDTIIQVFLVNTNTGTITLESEIDLLEQPGLNLPTFDFNNSNRNLQTIEEIEEQYLQDYNNCYVSVLLIGNTSVNYGELQYGTDNHYSIASYNRHDRNIICTEGIYENIFNIDENGNIILQSTIDITKLSKRFLLNSNSITTDPEEPIGILNFNSYKYSEILVKTSGVTNYYSYFKDSNNIYKNIILLNNPTRIIVEELIWNEDSDYGYFTKNSTTYNIENNLFESGIYKSINDYNTPLSPFNEETYKYFKKLASLFYYAVKSIENSSFTFTRNSESVVVPLGLLQNPTIDCPTYEIFVDADNSIKFWIGDDVYEGDTVYYVKIKLILNGDEYNSYPNSTLTSSLLTSFMNLIASYVEPSFPYSWN